MIGISFKIDLDKLFKRLYKIYFRDLYTKFEMSVLKISSYQNFKFINLFIGLDIILYPLKIQMFLEDLIQLKQKL